MSLEAAERKPPITARQPPARAFRPPTSPAPATFPKGQNSVTAKRTGPHAVHGVLYTQSVVTAVTHGRTKQRPAPALHARPPVRSNSKTQTQKAKTGTYQGWVRTALTQPPPPIVSVSRNLSTQPVDRTRPTKTGERRHRQAPPPREPAAPRGARSAPRHPPPPTGHRAAARSRTGPVQSRACSVACDAEGALDRFRETPTIPQRRFGGAHFSPNRAGAIFSQGRQPAAGPHRPGHPGHAPRAPWPDPAPAPKPGTATPATRRAAHRQPRRAPGQTPAVMRRHGPRTAPAQRQNSRSQG